MEARPEIDIGVMAGAIAAAYRVAVDDIAFLPLGADPEAAAWRVTVAGGPPLFLKTRHAAFDAGVLAVPRFLCDAGIDAVVAPLRTGDGALSVASGGATLILYPFVEGRNGFEIALTRGQWTELGAALKRIHAADLPAAILRHVETEDFGSRWRDRVRGFFDIGAPVGADGDAVARDLAALLAARRDDVQRIVSRAGELAAVLRDRRDAFVLCHTDIHVGNVLVGPDGAIHIVDWDSPRLAPKERDLMFVGGGVSGVWNEPAEAAAFYAGYGALGIDPVALAYYRYERIVEDFAVTCEQVFLGASGNRAESLDQLAVQWRPGDVVAIADSTYDDLSPRAPLA